MLWYFLSLPKILETYRINKSEAERLNDEPLNKFKDIKKYKDRGFAFNDAELEALYKDESIWEKFVKMITPTDHSVSMA